MKSATALRFVCALCLLMTFGWFAAGDEAQPADGEHSFRLSNEHIELMVAVRNGVLDHDLLAGRTEWLAEYGSTPFAIRTDADFVIDMMWSGWRAPGKVHNAANPILMNKSNFHYTGHRREDTPGGGEALHLLFEGNDNPFQVRVSYRVEPDEFFARKQLAIRDPKPRYHFLRWLWPQHSILQGDMEIVKAGGFGNPAALRMGDGGAFFGLEYPAAENALVPIHPGQNSIRCGQEFGLRVGEEWIAGEWAVAGVSPNAWVKYWFSRYVDSIRVNPIRPYVLYNSWYDVRSPEYTDRAEDVMNEANVLRIIGEFKEQMALHPGFKLDAFVLDDGWDVYQSDWALRPEEFPNGLAPIVEELKTMDCELGIWLGPIGGYSYRDRRVEWMAEHGYEAIGDELCLAGKNYHELFNKRVTDFVRDDQVGYFKWDGIQFSCSEADHGHPVGIYSRRAVMESVVDLCHSVRAENPHAYLNITSGTWLSPWWVKYADMIWMQGYDYGYADVPSISTRDGAITYRDAVLYEDFGIHDFWFPIGNLMTHGIIKGHLQELGGKDEPLDKFTNNAVLYFARGVSMWEFYISPNLLTDDEWNAIIESMHWARDRFEILKRTEMVGGDPSERKTYGFVHFNDERGVIAARNPAVEAGTLKVELAPSQGLDPAAASLVLERVYPTRWISPDLHAAGAVVEIPLTGFETAIYEVYPLAEAHEPLMAGVTFTPQVERGDEYGVRMWSIDDRTRLLNPELVKGMRLEGRKVDNLQLAPTAIFNSVTDLSAKNSGSDIEVGFRLDPEADDAVLAFLLDPAVKVNEENEPVVTLMMDGKPVEPEIKKQAGGWAWYKIPAHEGHCLAEIGIETRSGQSAWKGRLSAWLFFDHRPRAQELEFDLKEPLLERRPLPPLPCPAGVITGSRLLYETEIGQP